MPTQQTTRPLGERQQMVLDLLEKGRSYPGGGWTWGNRSTTIQILDSLVRRGLAQTEQVTGRVSYTRYTATFPKGR